MYSCLLPYFRFYTRTFSSVVRLLVYIEMVIFVVTFCVAKQKKRANDK